MPDFNPQNILVINFGQIGDVILSLPALSAIRKKFPAAKITLMVGKTATDIIELVDFVDEKITVDRVKMLKSSKLWAIGEIFKLVGDVRRRKFDFVIDLHSLYETNLLGFLSGAKHRLFSNRETRSLDSLSNFKPAPPLLDKSKHFTDYYLSTLEPLGIENAERFVQLAPRTQDLEKVNGIFQNYDLQGKKLIGLFPGAGNLSRRWRLENFAALANLLASDEKIQPIVFLGPEEKKLRPEIEVTFPKEIIIVDNLSLLEFAAALFKVNILISNDTGAIHIASMVGTSIIVVLDERAPDTFIPLTKKILAVRGNPLESITVNEVFQAIEIISSQEVFSNETSNKKQAQSG